MPVQGDYEMTHKDDERFFSKAEGYDKMAKYLVPQYEFLQDETLKLEAPLDERVHTEDTSTRSNAANT